MRIDRFRPETIGHWFNCCVSVIEHFPLTILSHLAAQNLVSQKNGLNLIRVQISRQDNWNKFKVYNTPKINHLNPKSHNNRMSLSISNTFRFKSPAKSIDSRLQFEFPDTHHSPTQVFFLFLSSFPPNNSYKRISFISRWMCTRPVNILIRVRPQHRRPPNK